MAYKLIWLPQVLKDAGLKVSEVAGWQDRGRADVGTIQGVLCHHTGGRIDGNMPSLNTLIHGRGGSSPLPGPLAQLGLGRDGTYYVIAAGRCNHAGRGRWMGIETGNSSFIGVEAENAGTTADPWPDVQVEAYRRGVAAILRHIGRTAEFCAGHLEYALPHGRKNDPWFDMIAFRKSVADILAGVAPDVVRIPVEEPEAQPGQPAPRPTLRRGATGSLVRLVQRAVGVDVDGDFGRRTEAAVRLFQRNRSMVPDGIVGPKTWRAVDARLAEL
jgi:peptidoglycan hydrolase-like protein with peptidoglycan-binding domain